MLKNLKKNENDKEDENMLLDHDLYEVMLLVYQTSDLQGSDWFYFAC